MQLISEMKNQMTEYNNHPYTSFTPATKVVKLFGWERCRRLVLENIRLGYSSKMNMTYEDLQVDFFCSDLQHLLSYYYKDIPRYYND